MAIRIIYKEFKIKIPDSISDAWHVAKSLMIILITLSIIFYKPFIPVIDMIVLGVIWNVSFNTSYKLFKNSK